MASKFEKIYNILILEQRIKKNTNTAYRRSQNSNYCFHSTLLFVEKIQWQPFCGP